MIGAAATFDSEDLANSLLEVLTKRELSPNRLGVTRSEDGQVAVIVEVDKTRYEEMAELMRKHGATAVELDMTGHELDSSGRPTLTDPEPPSPHDSG